MTPFAYLLHITSIGCQTGWEAKFTAIPKQAGPASTNHAQRSKAREVTKVLSFPKLLKKQINGYLLYTYIYHIYTIRYCPCFAAHQCICIFARSRNPSLPKAFEEKVTFSTPAMVFPKVLSGIVPGDRDYLIHSNTGHKPV